MATVMVTGAHSGIGAAFARAFAARGTDLILVARSGEALEAFAADLRARHHVTVDCLPADLADRADTMKVAETIESRTIDVLVNNAGFGISTSLLAEDLRPIERGLDVMCRAVLILGAAAGRTMKNRGHGAIINVSSVAGSITMGAYSAVKSWVTTYSESLAVELTGTNVSVTALQPGWVRTRFHATAGIGTSRIPGALWLDADAVVSQCLRDVTRRKKISVPSKRFAILGWLARHLPRPIIYAVSRKLSSHRRA